MTTNLEMFNAGNNKGFFSCNSISSIYIIKNTNQKSILTSHLIKPEELKTAILEMRPLQSGVKHSSRRKSCGCEKKTCG